MHRCAACGKICNYNYIMCSDHGGAVLSNWRESFSKDMRDYIVLCEYYARNMMTFGGDMHNSFIMIATFAKMMDEYWK